MGSRKNPNRRNAKTKYLKAAFQGYTKAICAQQRVDYLATGEFVSLPQVLAAMSKDRKPWQSLYDRYYANSYYKLLRPSTSLMGPNGYYAVNENHEYRTSKGRKRDEEEPKDLRYRARAYARALQPQIAQICTVKENEPKEWLKTQYPKAETIYGSVVVGDLAVWIHPYGDSVNFDVYIPAADVYRRAVRNDPRYCAHDSDDDGYQVLAVRRELPRGRYEAAAIQMMRGFPHLCTGYIYQYKKEWRFQPQTYNSVLHRGCVRLSREEFGGAA